MTAHSWVLRWRPKQMSKEERRSGRGRNWKKKGRLRLVQLTVAFLRDQLEESSLVSHMVKLSKLS